MTPNDNTFATGYGPEWQLRNYGTALITHEEAEFQTGMEDAAPGYYLWDLGEAPEGPQSLKIEDSFFQTGGAEIARLETIAVYLSERAERESMRVVAS